MKSYILSALSLVLFAQKSIQEDSPAQKACTALHQKYPELTAYGLDPRYSKANTGMLLFIVCMRFIYELLIWVEWNYYRLLLCQRLARSSMRVRTIQ